MLPPSGFHLQLQLQLLQLLPLACDALPSAFLPDEAVCREGTRGRGERRGQEKGRRGGEERVGKREEGMRGGVKGFDYWYIISNKVGSCQSSQLYTFSAFAPSKSPFSMIL